MRLSGILLMAAIALAILEIFFLLSGYLPSGYPELGACSPEVDLSVALSK